MHQQQRDVEDFHDRFGATVGLYPEMRERELRAKLILEEAVETVAAMGFPVEATIYQNNKADPETREPDPLDMGPAWLAHFEHAGQSPDFPGAIDGLCDLLYVTYGAAVQWGIDLEPFWRAVHEANMAKVGGGNREDGKVLKPEGWKPPDIEGELIRQERAGEVWRRLAEQALEEENIEVLAGEEAVA